jgi:hypothetical protein
MLYSLSSMLRTFCLVGCCCAGGGFCGCINLGSLKPGRMEWVQPQSDAPRAGSVYLIRGWVGVFSQGMDQLERKLNGEGVTARVFQDDQCRALARTMAERYKNAKNPEPICLIGHSYGSDDALIIARELDKASVPVDLIVTLDAVNESVVPKNVKLCYNYWQHGIFGASNFLRGIPLTKEPGGSGRLVNVNLFAEGRSLRDPSTNHINIGEAPKLHKAIIGHVLATFPERATWLATHPARDDVAVAPSQPSDVKARTAGAVLNDQRLPTSTSETAQGAHTAARILERRMRPGSTN